MSAPRRVISGLIPPATCRHTLRNSDGTCGWCGIALQPRHKHYATVLRNIDESEHGVSLFAGDDHDVHHADATETGWRCYLCPASGLANPGDTYADTWAAFLAHESAAHG